MGRGAAGALGTFTEPASERNPLASLWPGDVGSCSVDAWTSLGVGATSTCDTFLGGGAFGGGAAAAGLGTPIPFVISLEHYSFLDIVEGLLLLAFSPFFVLKFSSSSTPGDMTMASIIEGCCERNFLKPSLNSTEFSLFRPFSRRAVFFSGSLCS
eukprot:Skav202430  [mRNA]  locus=scaffold5371:50020:52751:+ [translate_table: standard]